MEPAADRQVERDEGLGDHVDSQIAGRLREDRRVFGHEGGKGLRPEEDRNGQGAEDDDARRGDPPYHPLRPIRISRPQVLADEDRRGHVEGEGRQKDEGLDPQSVGDGRHGGDTLPLPAGRGSCTG